MMSPATESARTPIEPARWGRDHWSTLAYLGHVVHAADGHPDRRRMRCKPGNPRQDGLMALAFRGEEYPTRLHDGSKLSGHDDYDCAEDLAAAGLLTIGGTGMFPVYALTPPGLLVWSYVCSTRRTAGAMESLTVDEVTAATGVTLPVPE